MIIGNGMIARRFLSDFSESDKVLVFASGVSSSKINDSGSFLREEKLLLETIQRYGFMKLVYFSTCSRYDPSLQTTPYIMHKCAMEDLILQRAPSFLICRTTNIVGQHGNLGTLINFLVEKIDTSSSFECWNNAVRNVLDIDHLFITVKALLKKTAAEDKSIINIYNPEFYPVKQIIHSIEQHLSKKAIYTELDKGTPYQIPDTYPIKYLFKELGINFKDDYLKDILTKYYPVEVNA